MGDAKETCLRCDEQEANTKVGYYYYETYCRCLCPCERVRWWEAQGTRTRLCTADTLTFMPQEDNRHKCWKSPIMAHLKAVMGLFFFVIHSPEVATHVHIYRLSICLSIVSLFVYPSSILKSMGVCRPSRALLYLVIYTPPYHSVTPFLRFQVGFLTVAPLLGCG